jgi:5-methylcytosine-specific restriction endonuclease McrA
MRKDILARKADVELWISENRPKAYICRQLDCKTSTLESYLKKWNIVYAGNMGEKGHKKSPYRKSALEYAHKEYGIKVPLLRKKLIQDGIKKEECEMCGISEWRGSKIVLELHHKDGNRHNNQINNLQILCPNCHSLTPNHSRKFM